MTTAGATTKGGLESADVWGDEDDVSLTNPLEMIS